MRFGWIKTTCFEVLLVGASALLRPVPKLIWNASTSVPIGLFSLKPAGALHIGELVVVTPPQALAVFRADRGYLAMGVPLLKHVLALPGHTVCSERRTITVNGLIMGRTRERDHLG